MGPGDAAVVCCVVLYLGGEVPGGLGLTSAARDEEWGMIYRVSDDECRTCVTCRQLCRPTTLATGQSRTGLQRCTAPLPPMGRRYRKCPEYDHIRRDVDIHVQEQKKLDEQR